MTKPNWVIAAAAALAGCHAAAPPANRAAANTADATNYQQQIAGLSEAARDGVFLRAVDDAGFECQKITAAKQHAPIGGRPAWVLQCERGTPYVALLDPGGYVQITPARPDDAPTAG